MLRLPCRSDLHGNYIGYVDIDHSVSMGLTVITMSQ